MIPPSFIDDGADPGSWADIVRFPPFVDGHVDPDTWVHAITIANRFDQRAAQAPDRPAETALIIPFHGSPTSNEGKHNHD
jgi:hypothetical protein